MDTKFDINSGIKLVWTRGTIYVINYIRVVASHTKTSEVGIGGEWEKQQQQQNSMFISLCSQSLASKGGCVCRQTQLESKMALKSIGSKAFP